MRHMLPLRRNPVQDSIQSPSLLDIEVGATPRRFELDSGRALEITTEGHADRLRIRGRGGEVVLTIRVDDEGPVLSFRSAKVDVTATRDLELSGRSVSIRAHDDMHVDVGRDRHTTIGGRELLEAGRVEMQANDEDVAIRARQEVLVDAEHIGLNDDPCPRPFQWSKPANEEVAK